MTVTLCCLLWAIPGREFELGAYEDKVLALIPHHGARVVSRVRSDGTDGAPLEVQLYEFASEASLDSYLADPRRVALGAERDAAIARTQLLRVEPVGGMQS